MRKNNLFQNRKSRGNHRKFKVPSKKFRFHSKNIIFQFAEFQLQRKTDFFPWHSVSSFRLKKQRLGLGAFLRAAGDSVPFRKRRFFPHNNFPHKIRRNNHNSRHFAQHILLSVQQRPKFPLHRLRLQNRFSNVFRRRCSFRPQKRLSNPPCSTNRLETKHLRLRPYRHLLQLPFFRFIQRPAKFCRRHHKQRKRIRRKVKIQPSKNIQGSFLKIEFRGFRQQVAVGLFTGFLWKVVSKLVLRCCGLRLRPRTNSNICFRTLTF